VQEARRLVHASRHSRWLRNRVCGDGGVQNLNQEAAEAWSHCFQGKLLPDNRHHWIDQMMADCDKARNDDGKGREMKQSKSSHDADAWATVRE